MSTTVSQSTLSCSIVEVTRSSRVCSQLDVQSAVQESKSAWREGVRLSQKVTKSLLFESDIGQFDNALKHVGLSVHSVMNTDSIPFELS